MQLMKAGNLYLPKVNQIPLIISNAKKLGLNALNVPVIMVIVGSLAHLK